MRICYLNVKRMAFPVISIRFFSHGRDVGCDCADHRVFDAVHRQFRLEYIGKISRCEEMRRVCSCVQLSFVEQNQNLLNLCDACVIYSFRCHLRH